MLNEVVIKIKNFSLEIYDTEQCNCAVSRCHEGCGIRSVNKTAKTPAEFINNFVELNQAHGFYVGFNDYEVGNDRTNND